MLNNILKIILKISEKFLELKTASGRGLVTTLQNIKSQYPSVENVVLADSTGKSINDQSQNLNISDREYFIRAKKATLL